MQSKMKVIRGKSLLSNTVNRFAIRENNLTVSLFRDNLTYTCASLLLWLLTRWTRSQILPNILRNYTYDNVIIVILLGAGKFLQKFYLGQRFTYVHTCKRVCDECSSLRDVKFIRTFLPNSWDLWCVSTLHSYQNSNHFRITINLSSLIRLQLFKFEILYLQMQSTVAPQFYLYHS